MSQFKVGDRVVCSNDGSRHYFKVGTILRGNYQYGTLYQKCVDVQYDEGGKSVVMFARDMQPHMSEAPKPVTQPFNLNDKQLAVFNAANELREAQIKFQKALDALNDNQ